MPDGSEARLWDMEKARLFGVIDRLHTTIEGLILANQQLTDSNRDLLKALADFHGVSGQAAPAGGRDAA